MYVYIYIYSVYLHMRIMLCVCMLYIYIYIYTASNGCSSRSLGNGGRNKRFSSGSWDVCVPLYN